jgi:hypothetical protein
MKTLDLPEGNAFGADESDSATPYVEDVEQRAQTLFFVWVTLTEHKWVIFGERREGDYSAGERQLLAAALQAPVGSGGFGVGQLPGDAEDP